ncbi:hypothetical protein TFLX_02285 [Thermoflexales bacterium]|nr:hypothetical protein TFLX_02285 [Thermoflexales bacterium]
MPATLAAAIGLLALMWATLVMVRFRHPQLTAGWCVGAGIFISLVVIQSALSLGALQTLHQHGGQLMQDVVQVSTDAGTGS